MWLKMFPSSPYWTKRAGTSTLTTPPTFSKQRGQFSPTFAWKKRGEGFLSPVEVGGGGGWNNFFYLFEPYIFQFNRLSWGDVWRPLSSARRHEAELLTAIVFTCNKTLLACVQAIYICFNDLTHSPKIRQSKLYRECKISGRFLQKERHFNFKITIYISLRNVSESYLKTCQSFHKLFSQSLYIRVLQWNRRHFFVFRPLRRHVRVHETEACLYAHHFWSWPLGTLEPKFPPIRDKPVIDNNKVKMAERERKVPDNHSSSTSCSETNGDTTSKWVDNNNWITTMTTLES